MTKIHYPFLNDWSRFRFRSLHIGQRFNSIFQDLPKEAFPSHTVDLVFLKQISWKTNLRDHLYSDPLSFE